MSKFGSVIGAAAIALLATVSHAVSPSPLAAWPPNLSNTAVAGGWNQAVGVCFAADGRLFVWEKAGRVYLVENGAKSLILDISEEVGDWRDHGLLGFALDPDFLVNGQIYLLYVVDYHYLANFGTTNYDPSASEYFRDTIGRVTRYACTPGDGFRSVDTSTRVILLGESITTGIPICNLSHGVGSLVFGTDKTLFVSCGDSASYDVIDSGGLTPGTSGTAVADGILRPEQDVGAFRSQLVDCHDGKVLRIDRDTGDGIPSNPFFDATAPRAARSRVWAMGLRNPYRMTLRPGTGRANPAAGRPGTLYIGDVGLNTHEELDVCDHGGMNFGWPIYEGLTIEPAYAAALTDDLVAPNPLAGAGCPQPWFRFQDLLAQATLGTPSWPNPCDPSQQIPATSPRFVHSRPAFDWSPTMPAQAAAWNGNDATEIDVDAANSPVASEPFGGSCAIVLAWYDGANFPPEFHGTLLLGDHAGGWIRAVHCDANGQPIQLIPFTTSNEAHAPVGGAVDPISGALYYVDYWVSGDEAVRKLEFVANQPPIAVARAAGAAVAFGPSPLNVQFTGSLSSDPEGAALDYLWDFGDGATSTAADPQHRFELVDDITALASIDALVLHLAPPVPLGSGNPNPEILRDGDVPPVGSYENWRQFDTFHDGDQGSVDWIEYAFSTPHEFAGVTFQEGRHFPEGGWFASGPFVEVGDGTTWTSVSALTTTPAYPGDNGVSYETFELRFQPVTATHIRLIGVPGGSAGFISAGELRVLATPTAGANAPTRRDVTLTVTDPNNATAVARVVVSLNNTPPVVQITSPVDGGTYSMAGPSIVSLTANVSDAEQGPGQRTCAWQTILHHDHHVHVEPVDANCSTTAQVDPDGCDGNLYYYEFRLTVTDDAGLSTTATSLLFPDCCASAGPPNYCQFCSGDASGTPCPCGTGVAGNGCPNSINEFGAHLGASGSAQVTNDTLVLDAIGMPNSASLFFQGSDMANGGAGVVLGDGLLCVGGQILRLRSKPNTSGAARYPEFGDASLSVRGQVPAAGATRSYQVWYRNAAQYCGSATFNTTNGVRVMWAP